MTGPTGPTGAAGSDDAWGRQGNAGTSLTTDFLGTTDSSALELRVNSTRALRLEPGGGLAAGQQAQAAHDGSFVWADSAPGTVSSTAADQVTIRASGGTVLHSDAAQTTGVQLAPGGGSWQTLSDVGLKDNLSPVDTVEVLRRLLDISIRSWNYRAQDPSIRHMGPTAQQFREAFGLGEGDRHISTVDADGIALAAIQGLYELLQRQLDVERQQSEAKDAEIADLKRRLAELERLVRSRLEEE